MGFARSKIYSDLGSETEENSQKTIDFIKSLQEKQKAYDSSNFLEAGLSDYRDFSLGGLIEKKGKNTFNAFSNDPISKEDYEASPYFNKDIPYTEGMTMKDAENRHDALERRKRVEAWNQESSTLEKVGRFAVGLGLGAFEFGALSVLTGGIGSVARIAGLGKAAEGINTGREIFGLSGAGKIAQGVKSGLGGGKLGTVAGNVIEGAVQGAAYETAVRKGGLTDELIKEGDTTAKERENEDILMAGAFGAALQGAVIPAIGALYKGGKNIFFKSKKPNDIHVDAGKNELILNEIQNGEKANLDILPNKSNEIKIDGKKLEMPESIYSKELDRDIIFNHEVRELDDIKHTAKYMENIEDLNVQDILSPEGINTFNKGSILTNADGSLAIGEKRLLATQKMFKEGGELLDNYLNKLQEAGIDTSKFEKPILTRILETPLEAHEIKALSNIEADPLQIQRYNDFINRNNERNIYETPQKIIDPTQSLDMQFEEIKNKVNDKEAIENIQKQVSNKQRLVNIMKDYADCILKG